MGLYLFLDLDIIDTPHCLRLISLQLNVNETKWQHKTLLYLLSDQVFGVTPFLT